MRLLLARFDLSKANRVHKSYLKSNRRAIFSTTGSIQVNVLLARDGALSEPEAWDVVCAKNSHQYPQDLLFTSLIAGRCKKSRYTKDIPYGKYRQLACV